MIKDLKDLPKWISGGKAFQIEGRARAKPLSQSMPGGLRNGKGAVGLELSDWKTQ